MKKILPWLFIFGFAVFTSGIARAQDDATQQQIDKLSGQIQDMEAAQLAQEKRIQALEKEISDLQDKLNQPAANNYASADDLKKLAGQVQEIDKKRQEDNEKILQALEKLGKTGVTASSHKAPDVSTTVTATDNSTASASVPQKGYDYTIQEHDTLTAIAKAYRDQGIKVTVDQILKANPGLNPNSLVVGKKIFIPAPPQ